MPKRSLPPVGGGEPIISTAGIPRPKTAALRPNEGPPLKLTLTVSPEAEAAGRDVVRLIAEACSAAATPKAVERVASLRFLFPEVAARVPEFHAFMDELVGAGRLDEVRRIMREPGGRGRPRTSLSLVALVEHVLVDNPGWTAKDAALHIFKRAERGDGLPYIPLTPRIQNVYSEYRKWYALWKQSLFVPAEIVTASSWREPGSEPTAFDAVVTMVPGAFILHSSDIEVGVVGLRSFDALYHAFAMAEGRTPLVAVDDPEFGPYTKYRVRSPDDAAERGAEGWRVLTERERMEARERCGLGDSAEPLESDRNNDRSDEHGEG